MQIAPNADERWRPLLHPVRPRPTALAPRLAPLRGIRAVALDIYGTMLCSGAGELGVATIAPDDAPATEALQAAGFTSIDPRAGIAARTALGRGIRAAHQRAHRAGCAHPEVDIRHHWRAVLRALATRGLIQGRLTSATVDAAAIAYEGRINPAWPMPGLGAALAALEARGILLTIVSNAQFYTPLLLAAFPETGWSRGAYASECCGWSWALGLAKPSPHLMRRVLIGLEARHGILPHNVLCIGNDMLNDLVPATHLGCRTALFAGDARSLRLRPDDPRCQHLRPDAVITHWHQLPALLAP